MKVSILLAILGTFLLTGCGDPQKAEFVKGCSKDVSVFKKPCSCVYDKLKAKYGDNLEFELVHLFKSEYGRTSLVLMAANCKND